MASATRTSNPTDHAPPVMASSAPAPRARLDHSRRSTEATASAWFSPLEVSRVQAYRGPLERLARIRMALGVAVLGAFVLGQAGPRLLDALALSSWVAEVVVMVVALQGAWLVFVPWFAGHRSLFYDRRWGLSAQTPRSFLVDHAKQSVWAVLVGAGVAVAFYAGLRGADAWWLPGGLLLAGYTVVSGFVYPMVISPAFSRVAPLADARLAGRLLGVIERAGLHVERIVVADASRRSRAAAPR